VPRGHEHAVDIDLHDPAPVLRRHVEDAAAPADSDIVVEAVEPAELLERSIDHGAGLLFVGNVRHEGSGRAPLLPDHRDGAFGSLLIEIDHENLGPGPGEQDRCRAAIPDAVIRRPAASDDRDLACEAERILPLRSIRHPVPPQDPSPPAPHPL
jgi:hypothetical protein